MSKKLEHVQLEDGVYVETLVQDDYEDGIQKLGVTLSNGDYYCQEWKWSGYTHDAYYKMQDLKLDPEEQFLLIRNIAEQVSGKQLWFYGCKAKRSSFKYGKYKLTE